MSHLVNAFLKANGTEVRLLQLSSWGWVIELHAAGVLYSTTQYSNQEKAEEAFDLLTMKEAA